MNVELKKALIFCTIAFLFFALFLPLNWIGESNDYSFHLARAKGEQNCINEGFSEWACQHYPPVFHWLASPFTFSKTVFKLFILFLFAFCTPLLLFFSCKKAVVVPAYFATSYFYATQAQLYAQGLTMMLVVLMVAPFPWKKGKWIIRTGIVCLAPFVHSHALPLLGFSFAVLAIEGIIRHWRHNGTILLQCSPFWGETPKIVQQPISSVDYAPQALTINSVLSFLVKGCPLPFLYFGLTEIRKQKALAILAIILLCAIASMENNRTLLCIPLLVLPYAMQNPFFEKKQGIILIALLAVFQLEQFVALKLFC